ncbi:MAG: bifunctional (p)ppGpp synthetase/guanosine-3',5'-bis(diphosphate) 3'-pyrophosphohydrolase, partial [Pseudobdellovibrionaceae bacterium]
MADQLLVDENLSSRACRTLDDLLKRIKLYYPGADLSLIERAYYFSEKAHEGQIRRSGEPYFSHPLAVAAILADLHLDLASIATGLLHDTVEDTEATLDDVRREFGEVVALLVDGVTKLSRMSFKNQNTHEKQGENIRKMIVAMGKDVRVILVKLTDRLHNMRTLNHMPYEKQAKIAQETLEIYAPLAGRLGIMALKIELEDLAFRFLRPDMYYQLSQQVAKHQKETDKFIDEVKRLLNKELEHAGFKVEIYGRSKHLWSIYKKMQSRNIEYDQVYDVLAFRVIVDNIRQCYEVLGHVHSLWKPIPGRFKDFIAMPKANNYQSLHTTVIGPNGERIEIQIRTTEMHLIAEKGIAAHWKYKEGSKNSTDQTAQQFQWLRELVSWHQQMGNSNEFLETVKTDLFDSEIYVFTPAGDVKEFPDGATPIDFAYAVHTDVGNRCVGARINGKLVPLKQRLQNGDSVEIVTSKTQTPSKDWLKYCVTVRAKSKIRAFVKEEQRIRALGLGKELVEKEFRKFGAAPVRYFKGEEFEKALRDWAAADLDELYVKVGYGKFETKHIVEKLAPELLRGPAEEKKTEESSFMERVFKAAQIKGRKNNSLVSVDGMGDVLVHFAKCCHPIPGDPICGFITRGRGITIHRADCQKAFEFDQLRKVDVEWNKTAAVAEDRTVKVRVVSQDMPGLLKAMSEAFAVHGANIQNAQIHTTKDKKAI